MSLQSSRSESRGRFSCQMLKSQGADDAQLVFKFHRRGQRPVVVVSWKDTLGAEILASDVLMLVTRGMLALWV